MRRTFFILCFALAQGLFAQSNATAAQDFVQRFGTDQASWAQEGNTHVATFKANQGPAYAEYDDQGNYLGLASLSDLASMPAEAQTFLERGFTGENGNGPYDLQYVRLLDEGNGAQNYVAILVNASDPNQFLKLYFDSVTGTLERRALWSTAP